MEQSVEWLMLLSHLGTPSKSISEHVPTCEKAHSWPLYSAFPPEDLAASTITWYLSQPHYSDIEPTSPYPVLIMIMHGLEAILSTLKLVIWLDQYSNTLVSQNGSWTPYSFDYFLFFSLFLCARIIYSQDMMGGLWMDHGIKWEPLITPATHYIALYSHNVYQLQRI